MISNIQPSPKGLNRPDIARWWRQFWTPRLTDQSPWEWCDENLICDDTSFTPGCLWDSGHSPFVRQIMEDFANPEITDEAIQKCAQSAITQAFMGCVCHSMDQSPAPTLWVSSTGGTLETFAKGRMMPTLERCRKLRLPTSSSDKGVYKIFFPGMLFAMVPSGARGELQSVPIKRAIFDEVRDYPKGHYELAQKRTRAHGKHNPKRVTISCPDMENDHVNRAYNDGNRNRWQFKCPFCRESTHLRFFPLKDADKKTRGGLRWDTNERTRPGGSWNWLEAMQTVRYHCPLCDGKMLDTREIREDLIYSKGVWIPQQPTAPPTHTSYHINALLPKWVSWADLFMEFAKARIALKVGDVQPLYDFVTQTLGDAWQLRQEYQGEAVIVTESTDYLMGEKWEKEVCRFLTVDKQAKGYWFEVRGHADDAESRLHDAGFVDTKDEIYAKQLEWNIETFNVGMDSNYNPDEVHQLCAQYGWISLAGRDVKGYKHLDEDGGNFRVYSTQHTVDGWTGTGPDQEAFHCLQYTFADAPAKNLLLTLKLGGKFTIPSNAPKAYKDHQDGEAKIPVVNKATGEMHYEWREVGGRQNHLLDTAKMQCVFASMEKLIGLEAVERRAQAEPGLNQQLPTRPAKQSALSSEPVNSPSVISLIVAAAIASVENGLMVKCAAPQYLEVRAGLQKKASEWKTDGEKVLSKIAIQEMKNLDERFISLSGTGIVRK